MDNLELKIIRGAIAMRGVKNKDLAFSMGLAPATLSEFLHGYRPMPYEVNRFLVNKLGIADTLVRAKSEQDALVAMA